LFTNQVIAISSVKKSKPQLAVTFGKSQLAFINLLLMFDATHLEIDGIITLSPASYFIYDTYHHALKLCHDKALYFAKYVLFINDEPIVLNTFCNVSFT
jgi:hypothetical protein